jgi:hypothetical protein
VATKLTPLIVLVRTEEFQRGIREGRQDRRPQPRFDLKGCVTESGVLEIVRNMCEMYFEGELSDQQRRHDTGLIVGWTLRACQDG